MIFINTEILLNDIKKDTFSRQDIIEAATAEISGFKTTDIRNLIEDMINRGEICRVAHNRYVRSADVSNKSEYKPVFSEEALKVINVVAKANPYTDFQVWELSWFNEFLIHLVACNIIFIDVEGGGCEFVYSSLPDEYLGKVLLLPNAKELQYYSKPDTIIIEKLISESPNIKGRPHEAPIEKLLVELFANKILRTMLSQGDYANILETVFSKYLVDELKLFRYANRRNKKDEIIHFINENTNIRIMKEV